MPRGTISSRSLTPTPWTIATPSMARASAPPAPASRANPERAPGNSRVAGRLELSLRPSPVMPALCLGCPGHPLCMVQELDESFDALMFLGYPSKAGSDGNPLAHTLSLKVSRLAINGETASELFMHSLAAAMFKVPVAFVSGDEGICA